MTAPTPEQQARLEVATSIMSSVFVGLYSNPHYRFHALSDEQKDALAAEAQDIGDRLYDLMVP